MTAIIKGLEYSGKYVPRKEVKTDHDTEKIKKIVIDGVKKVLKLEKIKEMNKAKIEEMGENH